MDKINRIKELFDKLQATSGRIDKESILKENTNNEDFKNIIYFLLNSYIVTGLSAKKINKNIGVLPNINYNITELLDLLDYLKTNNTGRDVDISICESYFTNFDTEIQEFIKSILTKSIKIGVDAKTINKVWGKGFIPTFECMLAEKYFEHPEKVEGKNFTITLKLDGIRCLLIKESGKVSLFSRQGQLIEGLVDIEAELINFNEDNIVLDGELLISNTDNIPSKEQYKATTKIIRKDGEKHGITYRIFDCMTLNCFKEQKAFTLYKDRRWWLNQNFNQSQYVKPLPTLYSGSDISMISKILDEVRADDQEGIMININDAPYEFKRTMNLLKVKVMQDCDLKIIGFEEGSGRLKGTLGRLNVDYKGNVLGVGGGFSDNDRKYFWENQDDLLGRVITVQFFEETQNKNGKLSLRFPVFKELREIGKQVSYS